MPYLRAPSVGLALLGLLAAGCQSVGRLGEYDFAGRALFVVYDFPPRPEVLTGPYFPGHPDNPVHPLMRIAGHVVREIAAEGARERLDSAVLKVDIGAIVADRASLRIARYMRAELVEDEADADFGLEVRIRDFGIDAEEWDAAAHVFVQAELILFDAADGREIWQTEVRERDPIGPHIFGGGHARPVRDVVTAASLSSMSVEEMEIALEYLGEYAGDRISERLRDSLEKVRDRR